MRRAALIVAGALVVLYLADYALLRHKMSNPDQTVAYGTITSFYGTATKGGKMEIFTDQPQTETCVHSLFPHATATSPIRRHGFVPPPSR